RTVIKYCISCCTYEPFNTYMSGFSELINAFDKHKFKLPIGDMSDIDVNDWTELIDCWDYEMDNKITQWFWQVI
ncbi:hypothetical protein BS47DRAFT_1253311, partial [Hydnum rufescens UP504]